MRKLIAGLLLAAGIVGIVQSEDVYIRNRLLDVNIVDGINIFTTGASDLAVATGTSSGFTVPTSSPTSVFILERTQFQTALKNATTVYVNLHPTTISISTITVTWINASSMTISKVFWADGTTSTTSTGGGGGGGSGDITAVNTTAPLTGGAASGDVTLDIDRSSFTLQGPIVSSITLAAMYGSPTLTGTNITGIPGSNLTGTVPTSVLPSTITYTISTQTISGMKTFSSTSGTLFNGQMTVQSSATFAGPIGVGGADSAILSTQTVIWIAAGGATDTLKVSVSSAHVKGVLEVGTGIKFPDGTIQITSAAVGGVVDTTKLPKDGSENMSGQLTSTTGTFTGASLSVGVSTFVVNLGQVGIGTSSPISGSKLDVAGITRSQSGIYVSTYITGGYVEYTAGVDSLSMVSIPGKTLLINSYQTNVTTAAGNTGTIFKVSTETVGLFAVHGTSVSIEVPLVFPDGTVQVSAAAGSGDIEGVTAGIGLDGGGTSGTVTLDVDPSTVTMQGPIVSSITLASMYGSPTLTGTNFTGIPQPGVTNLTTDLAAKVAKAGDTMSGQLTVQSSVTFTHNAFTVGGSTFVVVGGRVGIGTTNPTGAMFDMRQSTWTSGTLANSGMFLKTIGAPYAAADVISAFYGLMINTGTVTSAGDVGHLPAFVFRVTDTVNGSFYTIAVEPRIDAFGETTYIGNLSLVHGQHTGASTATLVAYGIDLKSNNMDDSTANPYCPMYGILFRNWAGGQSTSSWVWHNAVTTSPFYNLGNIGLGNLASAPGDKITISDTGANPSISITGISPTSQLKMGILNTSSATWIGSTLGQRFALYSGAAERVSISSGTGNVGIGNTAPSYKLDVNGNINSTGTFIGSGAQLTSIPADQLSSGIIPDARMPDLTGDVTTVEGAVAATIADNSVDGTDIALGSDAQGDVMYYDGTNWVRLAKGLADQVLEMNAGATAPEWDTDNTSAGGGDDMGNHIATIPVNMAGFAVIGATDVASSRFYFTNTTGTIAVASGLNQIGVMKSSVTINNRMLVLSNDTSNYMTLSANFSSTGTVSARNISAEPVLFELDISSDSLVAGCTIWMGDAPSYSAITITKVIAKSYSVAASSANYSLQEKAAGTNGSDQAANGTQIFTGTFSTGTWSGGSPITSFNDASIAAGAGVYFVTKDGGSIAGAPRHLSIKVYGRYDTP